MANKRKKLKWARKEIRKRTSGTHNTLQENQSIVRDVWNEANMRFG